MPTTRIEPQPRLDLYLVTQCVVIRLVTNAGCTVGNICTKSVAYENFITLKCHNCINFEWIVSNFIWKNRKSCRNSEFCIKEHTLLLKFLWKWYFISFMEKNYTFAWILSKLKNWLLCTKKLATNLSFTYFIQNVYLQRYTSKKKWMWQLIFCIHVIYARPTNKK
jgi:hypothetical protein